MLNLNISVILLYWINKLYSYVGVFRACQYNNLNIYILYTFLIRIYYK